MTDTAFAGTPVMCMFRGPDITAQDTTDFAQLHLQAELDNAMPAPDLYYVSRNGTAYRLMVEGIPAGSCVTVAVDDTTVLTRYVSDGKPWFFRLMQEQIISFKQLTLSW
jgi:hypothetical protein